eukprot:s3347_g3.t1
MGCLGLRSSRAGYELTIAVQQAVRLGTQLRWVNGLAMLADGLTKAGAKKDLLNFFVNRQRWSIVHDESFTAGKRLHKVALQKKLSGSCPSLPKACADDGSFKDHSSTKKKDAAGNGCLAYIGYECPGAVLEACPRSCGSC